MTREKCSCMQRGSCELIEMLDSAIDWTEPAASAISTMFQILRRTEKAKSVGPVSIGSLHNMLICTLKCTGKYYCPTRALDYLNMTGVLSRNLQLFANTRSFIILSAAAARIIQSCVHNVCCRTMRVRRAPRQFDHGWPFMSTAVDDCNCFAHTAAKEKGVTSVPLLVCQPILSSSEVLLKQ